MRSLVVVLLRLGLVCLAPSVYSEIHKFIGFGNAVKRMRVRNTFQVHDVTSIVIGAFRSASPVMSEVPQCCSLR